MNVRVPPAGLPDVSVIVPIRNEAKHIRQVLQAMRAQRFDGRLEFLLVDGMSDDGTREILEREAGRDAAFRLVDNPRRCTPHALNAGLREARGRVIVRMDAHTLYPPDYVRLAVERLSRGDVTWVTGPALPCGEGRWSRRVELALRSWLGVGGASFRKDCGGEVVVDTGFAGAMARETLERLGGWDERWPINQDAELAARIREDGGTIVCLPELAAEYVPRDGLGRLARQYWRYGRYRVKTAVHHPASMRPSHVLAPGLVLTLIAALVGPGPLRSIARAGLLAYAAATLTASAKHLPERPADAVWLPAVFATMHLAWGAGYLAGVARHGLPVAALLHALARTRSTALSGARPPGDVRARRPPPESPA